MSTPKSIPSPTFPVPESITQRPSVTTRRCYAYLIDLALHLLVAGWVFVTIADKVPPGSPPINGIEVRLDLGASGYRLTGTDGLLFILGAFAFWCVTRAALHALTGRTLGKAILALAVTNIDGRRPTLTQACMRELTWPVDGFPYALPGLTGYLKIRDSADQQRLGDRLANTHVIHRPLGRLRPRVARAADDGPRVR